MSTPPFFKPKEGYALILTMLMEELGIRTDAPAKAIVASTFLVLKQNGEPIAEWSKLRKLVHIPACRTVLSGMADEAKMEWPAKAQELLESDEEAVSEDMLRAMRAFKRNLTDEDHAAAFETVKARLPELAARRGRRG